MPDALKELNAAEFRGDAGAVAGVRQDYVLPRSECGNVVGTVAVNDAEAITIRRNLKCLPQGDHVRIQLDSCDDCRGQPPVAELRERSTPQSEQQDALGRA